MTLDHTDPVVVSPPPPNPPAHVDPVATVGGKPLTVEQQIAARPAFVEPPPPTREDRVTSVIASLEHAMKHNAPVSIADIREIEALLLPEADQAALAVKRLNMPVFRERAPAVNAFQITDAMVLAPHPGVAVDPNTRVMSVETADGVKPVVAGDWIVRDGDGKLTIYKADTFADRYQAA
jgi:hypothetical protein